MTHAWKHIRPHDTYMVYLTQPVSPFHQKLLSMLYQPLMGGLSLALYTTLMNEAEGDRCISAEIQHQSLVKTMGAHLEQIYKSRLRLEALGLLKTIRVNERQNPCLEYHLYLPLEPPKFFEDELLSVSLYNQVGAKRFKELRARFSAYMHPGLAKADSIDLTKQFHEVFTAVQPSELVVHEGTEVHRDMLQWAVDYPLPDPHQTETDAGLPFDRFELDAGLVNSFLMKDLQIEHLYTEKQWEQCRRLAFFYQLDEYQLSRLIHDALDERGQLQMANLRRKAADWYRWQYGENGPKLVHLVEAEQSPALREDQIQSEEDRHLFVLERLSPLQLLQEYQNGGKVADADQKLLEELVLEYELPPAVVNLLVEYILLTNGFKLPRNLVTKVAAHWKRSGVTDIRQAQTLAKKEHAQYKMWQERREQSSGHVRSQAATSGASASARTSAGKAAAYNQAAPFGSSSGYKGKAKQVRRDKLPDWIANPPDDHASTPISNEQKKRRIENLLKALGEWDDEST